MRYLSKTAQSIVIDNQWKYSTKSQRPKIRETLIKEQKGYCAYSEKYIQPTHASEIEHFDDSKKNTLQDDYWNWYAVLRKINQIKMSKKIVNFQPILCPYKTEEVTKRICYKDGQFQPVQEEDIAAKNLIDFLGWNDPTLAQERNGFIDRIKKDRARFFSDDSQGFIDYLKEEPGNLSFITALEVELNIKI